jgi:hypothetical protein
MQSPVQTIVNAVLGTGTPPAADPARLAADLRALDVELEAATAAFADAALAEAAGTQDGATSRARAEMVRDRLAGRREALAAALSRAQANALRDTVERDEAARRAVWQGVRVANAARNASVAELAQKLAELARAYRTYQADTRSLVAAMPAPPADVDGSLLKAGAIETLMVLELKRLGCNLGADISPSILHGMPSFTDRLGEAGRVIAGWIPGNLGEDA